QLRRQRQMCIRDRTTSMPPKKSTTTKPSSNDLTTRKETFNAKGPPRLVLDLLLLLFFGCLFTFFL
ncbi:hypothetical protein KQJ29_22285, partial [Enterococcus sp. S181_ASV_20]|nr:hypothetical protein [Enterococcus sp. S181_ASV_20]